jgi:hypothetical protein
MSRSTDWRDYVDDESNFQLAQYLYFVNLDLMKNALDMGTLLSTDSVRLRAYKEQIKSYFKNRWLEIAEALEDFDVITPCGCTNEYCTICGGSRYRLNGALSSADIRKISVVVDPEKDSRIRDQLVRGLEDALEEVRNYPLYAE